MNRNPSRTAVATLNLAPLLLFASVLITFGSQSPKFLTGANLVNILIQSSGTAVVAIGMTFVLITAGVDLSVGAIMFVGAAVAGKMLLSGMPIIAALGAMIGIGLACGVVNALLIARLRVIAFIATLVTLYLGRGLALWITETRAMNLPPAFHDLGAAQLWGAPVPVLVFASLAILAHLTLGCTPYGRQLYSIGQDSDRARRAGVMVGTLVGSVYLVSGLCAALGGILSLSQIGSVSPTFGFQKEFTAIAAAVLGGTSLFGGRGTVLPGTVMGALLMQSVENGLVIINANPYLYPLISSVIIFIAVLTDSMRSRWMELFHRRRIIP